MNIKEENKMQEKIVEFKFESKNDNRIYLHGTVDINTIDDLDGGDWGYEQNNGTYASHLPHYWKVDGESLSFEYGAFIDCIDWEMFRQWIWDYQDENRTIDCGVYYLHINNGASIDVKITLDEDFEENYRGELQFTYNGKPLYLDKDIFNDLTEALNFYGDDDYTAYNGIGLFHGNLPKIFSNYIGENYEGEREEIRGEWIEDARQCLARQLSRDAGILNKCGENIEQMVEAEIASDYACMWEFYQAIDNDNGSVDTFLREHDYI